MPSRTKPLKDAMRDIIADMVAEGGGRARTAAIRLAEAHPDLFAAFHDEHAMNDLTAIARAEFKRWQAVPTEGRQYAIPGLAMDRLPSLPACINVPLDDGETFYRPLRLATVGELRACIGARGDQLRQDEAILRDLRTILDHRLYQGADDDAPVFEPRPRPVPVVSDQPGAPA